MTYQVVDFDGGDVLGVFGHLEAALVRARALVQESPELTGDIAVVPMNSDGSRGGDPVVIGEQVISPSPATA